MSETNPKEVFVVKMNRWGDSELHSYVEGVYDTREQAEEMGQLEKAYRGGKYEPEILSCLMNNSKTRAQF